jgi:hypothetical protein
MSTRDRSSIRSTGSCVSICANRDDVILVILPVTA